MSCSYEDCNFECYDSNNKCIFHYNKRDWLTPKTKVWKSDSKEKIKYFWSEIRRLKDQINRQFIGFIFPEFEEFLMRADIQDGMYRIQPSDSNYLNNYSFGYKDRSNGYYSILNDVSFQDAIFLDIADFSKIFLNGTTIFTNTVFEKSISFSWNTLENIHFDNVNFKREIDFNGFILKNCKFTNTVFVNKINFVKTTFIELNFKNSTFKHEVSFEDGNMKGNINFENVTFNKEVNFQKQKFMRDNSKDTINFSKVKASDINFRASIFVSHIHYGNILIKFEDKGEYGKIDFSDANMHVNIEISNSKFKSIIWRNITLSKTTKCTIRNIEIDEFILDRYKNESEEKILFDFVRVNNRLEISYVDFSKEKFNQFNLTTANVEIINSSFNGDFFNSVKWGTISEDRYKATRDIFRQLKSYSEQQKNFIDADGFYSLEMKERKKELREESKQLKGFELVKHFFTDIAVFYIHEKTSDFSQNWVLPIIWLFLLGMIGVICKNFNLSTLSENIYFLLPTSILLFLLPLIYEKYEKIKKIVVYWYLFIPTIALYIAFSTDKLDDIAVMINPSKIFTSVPSTSISGEFIYLLYKIAILFLVYQVVIAMKKKVRSK